MTHELSPELFWLTLTVGLTGLLWIPYLINRIAEIGPQETLGIPRLKPDTPWAERLMRAHANAVENLAVFTPLALITVVSGMSSSMTTLACAVYFWARVTHVAAYVAAIPVMRTLAFTAGFFSQAGLALHLLGRI